MKRRKTRSSLALVTVLGMLLALLPMTAASAAEPIFINEIHYDNAGTDAGEAVEVAGPAGTDLTGWSIVLYNGSNGAVYDTITLSGIIPDQQGGFGTLDFSRAGIQNGAPDGLVLVGSSSLVVQFLSYEGSFIAVDGPAIGMTSTDIGVAEASDSAVGDSLQLTGTGSMDEDFTWSGSQPNTFGSVNTGQVFGDGGGGGPADPVINEFVANHTGADTEAFVEIAGDPSTDYSVFTVLEIEGDSTGAGVVDAALPVGTTGAGGFWTDSEDMENGTVTVLLVEGFTGATGLDLDTDNDGTFDSAPWTRIVDDVATTDGDPTDQVYSSIVLAAFFDGAPFGAGGASRIPNGVDTDALADWVRNDYDGFGFPGFVGSPSLGEAVNTPGAANEIIDVLTDPLGLCGDPATFIHDIQGSGAASTDVGSIREIEGIVVGDFQGSSGLRGFFLQEEDAEADGDPLTSEGIFVYDGSSPAVDVSADDVVRVRGSVKEQYGLTEITDVTSVSVCDQGTVPGLTVVDLPVADLAFWETVEGMSVVFPYALYVSDNYNQGYVGEVELSVDGPLEIPTNVVAPGGPAIARQDLNDRSRIQLDDGSSWSNLTPPPYFTVGGTLRTGDYTTGLTGVIGYSYDAYELQPTHAVVFEQGNARPTSPPDVGGSLQVAAFNVLNYFTTLDGSGPICGPSSDQDCRGADNAFEFTRQRDKIISAIGQMDADVVGLMEIENHPGDVPTADLVSGLNAAGYGAYAYVATGAVGSDAIRQAIIYQPASVTPVGPHGILDSSVDPTFDDEKNRPVVAQTFMDNSTGEVFTVAVNHLKSKGSSCDDVDDPDTGDGQGNCNVTRTSAAQAMADWLASDPTSSGDSDFLIIGDLNSYAMEDPIIALESAGFTDLIEHYVGSGYQAGAYSYTYYGQAGYLDHGLASESILSQVTGAAFWHINAAEPSGLDYNDYNQTVLYSSGPFRSSDHDPVIIGLNLGVGVWASPDTLWAPNHQYVDVEVSAMTNAGTPLSAVITEVTSSEDDAGYSKGDKPDDVGEIDGNTVELRAERYTPQGRVYTVHVDLFDGAILVTSRTVDVVVPHDQRDKNVKAK